MGLLAAARGKAAGFVVDGPLFVGEIELSDARSDLDVPETQVRYSGARLLVRLHHRPLGFVMVPLVDRHVSRAQIDGLILRDLNTALAQHLRSDGLILADGAADDGFPIGCRSTPDLSTTVSVVVCTRDRPQNLRSCLDRLKALRYPNLEVLIVDSAPQSPETRDIVHDQMETNARIRYVLEPVPGLSRARNRGLAEATGGIVAFTDDDVLVDPWWLHGVALGFSRDARVACVTGLVPAAHLENDVNLFFEHRVTWAASCIPCIYDLDQHKHNSALYPFAAGLFGTGANFAVNRAFMLGIGGFDEALGVGSRSQGGEDLDAFVRTLLGGRQIAYEPSAIVWHFHRAEIHQLRRQMFDYGLGLSAFVTKHLVNPRTAAKVLVRAPRGLWHAGRLLARSERTPRLSRRLVVDEVLGMLAGPGAYLLARRDVRRRTKPVATVDAAFSLRSNPREDRPV